MIIIPIISWYIIQQLKANLWNVILRTTVQRLSANRLKESIIFNILYRIGCIRWPSVPMKRGRLYMHSWSTVILRCFIVRIWWFRPDSNNGLHIFLYTDYQYNYKLALACGLVKIPSSRRTFDRRLKTIFTDIKQRISTMRHLFVAEGIVDISITAIDRVHSLKSKR
jgi:hypothetical protein